MIEQEQRYQLMNQIYEILQEIQSPLCQLEKAPTTSKEYWEQLEAKLDELNAQCQKFEESPRLEESNYTDSEWHQWSVLIENTKQLHEKTLQRLIEAKETFYCEVRQVGQSVKAHQAYNNMKRIQF